MKTLQTPLRLLCTDIDGTLLDRQKSISVRTQLQIRRVIENFNTTVILVSARMPKAMRYLQKMLHLNEPIISYNGALILGHVEPDGGVEILAESQLPYDPLQILAQKATQLDTHIGIFSYDDWHVNRMDWGTEREIEHTQHKPNTYSNLQSILNSYQSLQKAIHKAMFIGEEEDMNTLEAFARRKFGQQLHIYRSKETYIEVSPIQTSKATALKLLAEKLQFQPDEIIAFGDNFNDIEMLQYAGIGVAMGNARPEVKAIADDVTLPYTEDGVAVALEKYFLEQES